MAASVAVGSGAGIHPQDNYTIFEESPPPLPLDWATGALSPRLSNPSVHNDALVANEDINDMFEELNRTFETAEAGIFPNRLGSISTDFTWDPSLFDSPGGLSHSSLQSASTAPLDLPFTATPRSRKPSGNIEHCSASVLPDVSASGYESVDINRRSGDSPADLLPMSLRDTVNSDAVRSSNSSTTWSSGTPCQCLTSALTVLETLSIEDSRTNWHRLGHLLQFTKGALNECNYLLECPRCSCVSNFMMLLIVVCQKTITTFEHVLVVLTERYQVRHSSRPSQTVEASSKMGMDKGEARVMAVKGFEMEGEEEPCLFGALTSIQLRSLGSLLVRIKTIMPGWKWEQHVVIVDSVGERVKEQLKLFEKSSGY
ncbi:hypothetical protein MMC17_007068 [Xylographa soralifera]|nr:hypothetical protein [Xylographa soralifera]